MNAEVTYLEIVFLTTVQVGFQCTLKYMQQLDGPQHFCGSESCASFHKAVTLHRFENLQCALRLVLGAGETGLNKIHALGLRSSRGCRNEADYYTRVVSHGGSLDPMGVCKTKCRPQLGEKIAVSQGGRLRRQPICIELP